MRKLFSLVAVAALVIGACQPTASTAPSAASASPSASASASASPSGSASASPSASAGAEAPDITTTNYSPEPVGNRGGRLVFATSGEPITAWWNIYDSFAGDVEGFGHSLWGLTNYTADFKYYPQLVTEVPTVENGGVVVTGDTMSVTYNLIPGALWSDGEPITCQDMADQVTWQLDPAQSGNIQGKTGWEDIENVEGGDGTTCKVNFKQIYEQYLDLWKPLLPMHYVETAPVAEALNQLYTQADIGEGVYSGPYIPTSWTAEAQIDYVKNDEFWQTIKKAEAPFDEVVFRFYATPDAMIAGFQNGEADIAIELNHTHIPALGNVPTEQQDIIDGTTYEHHSYNLESLTEKFGAEGARAFMEALHYATDKEAINQRVLQGTATPSCNFMSPLAWSYADIPCYEHDKDKAAQILADAGFTKGSDGVLEMNGNKAILRACTRADRQYRVDTLTFLAAELQPLGITVDLENVATDPGTLFEGWELVEPDAPCNLTRGNFEVTEFAWVATVDPTSINNLYRSDLNPSLGDHSGQNYIRVNNPELDEMLENMIRTVDLLEIKEDMARIQELYVDPANGFPEIALYNWKTVGLKKPNMHNFVNNSTAATQSWNIEDWWRDAQ